MFRVLSASTIVAAVFIGFMAIPAAAKIRCQGNFQIIPGAGFHSSPYCQIRYLAAVARGSYGMSTSFRRLRFSYSTRKSICRAIGHDRRVASACVNYRNTDRGRA